MHYSEFLARTRFSKEELLAYAYGRLVEDATVELSRLPAPPMLMIDRIVSVERRRARGRIVGEWDIAVDDWFFHCHFRDDPVQPGCLGVDAIWQLVGLYCSLAGAPGAGRALGCKEIEFAGQIRPHNRLVRYEVDIRRFSLLKATGSGVAIGDARVLVDGEHIYTVKGAKVGTFVDIAYTDYPARSSRGTGGIMGGS